MSQASKQGWQNFQACLERRVLKVIHASNKGHTEIVQMLLSFPGIDGNTQCMVRLIASTIEAVYSVTNVIHMHVSGFIMLERLDSPHACF